MTLCYETNEEGKRFPRVKKENHLTLVAEPKSEFLSSLAEATVLSRRIMPQLTSKKDFAVMINKS